MTTILRNGNSIRFRPPNESEQAKIDRDRERARRIASQRIGSNPDDPNWCEACYDIDVGLCADHRPKRAFHAVLLDIPEPGDDLTYDVLPQGYDEVRVQWAGDNSTYSMRINAGP